MRRLLTFLFHDVYRATPDESGFGGPAAARYKLSLAEFEAHLSGIARTLTTPAVTLPIRSDGAGIQTALTFDDGGLSYYTVVADRLEALGRHGHCFIPTSKIGSPGFLDKHHIVELRERGHVIGSHSVSHPARMSSSASDQLRFEWGESTRVLEDIVGHEITVASVPAGYFSRRVAAAAAEAGLTTIFTSDPVTTVRDVAGCTVLGRFTVRAGMTPRVSAALARLDRVARFRERATWNAKCAVKMLLGQYYSKLAHRRVESA